MMKETSTIEKVVQVVSTLAIEELYFDSESKAEIYDLANGKKTTKDFLAELNKKYGRQQVCYSNSKE